MQQVERANATGRQPVVFIHGLWLLPSSWDRWATLFEEAGYTALTPGWPDDPETVEEAKANPEVFAHKTIEQVADHFDGIVQGLNKKPALIGHSFGGLLAQMLAGRGRASATVAIDPAGFRGVLPLPLSALKSAWPVLGNPANRNRAIPLTFEQFRFAFANAVSETEAHELYDDLRRAGVGHSSVSGRGRQPQPVDGGAGGHGEPGARAAADPLRREGQHRPAGGRPRGVRAAGAQRRRDGVCRSAQPWTRADD